MSQNTDDPCGCDDGGHGERPERTDREIRDALERKHVRALATPVTFPRTSLHRPARGVKEITLHPPGTQPVSAVVGKDTPLDEVLRELERRVTDLPRRDVGPGKGALDVLLEGPDGGQTKNGTVVIEGAGGKRALTQDASTRRFSLDGLTPGKYTVRAASVGVGRRTTKMEVRDGDVTRAVMKLDGSRVRGKGNLRVPIRGTHAPEVRVRATNRSTGKVVFHQVVKVDGGYVILDGLDVGRLHLDIDDGTGKSCYDVQSDGLLDVLDLPIQELLPKYTVDPEPFRVNFPGLGDEYREVIRILPEFGIKSVDDLAASEPEALMHLAAEPREKGQTPISSRRFGDAVVAARQALGKLAVQGEVQVPIRLDRGGTVERAMLPATYGPVTIESRLPADTRGTLVVDGPFREKSFAVAGKQTMSFDLSHDDFLSGEPLRFRFTNETDAVIAGDVRVMLPSDRVHKDIVFPPPDPAILIDQIMAALAPINPGLASVQVKSALAKENIDAWLDHGRTVMQMAGVCSINDLGRFRMNPVQKLRPGIYVAPKMTGPLIADPIVLDAYSFLQTLNGEIHYYVPNEVLHETAIVLADDWDIRGQTMVVANDVRELLVIARRILHDSSSRITWEESALPVANAYWPNPASTGANGSTWGADGQDGGDGDQNPHPSKNGGAAAVTAAPTLTMWVLDATNNLPPIDLRGQQGGTGGRGQDGGRGGDGHQGRRASGHWYSGCCRGVGHGGDGGDGGDGGRGGKGGRGGEGGAITVLTSAESLSVFAADTPQIDVNPGSGGLGGLPGNGGQGGRGGPAGTADCEAWCDEHPERRGADGANGIGGSTGFTGDTGNAVPSDAIQFIPVTEEQWEQALNNPHILTVTPLVAAPGDLIQITGANFDPAVDQIYYDGFAQGPVATATSASFTVPITADGGWHPIVIRPAGVTDRRSNKVLIQILPVLDAIPPNTRWVENEGVTLTGLAIRPGAQVIAQDWSASPIKNFILPVLGSTRTSIQIQIPGGPLGDLRGVRRIAIRNPDGGESRDERVARISDTIVVRCAAWRVVGSTAGTGTQRSAADIDHLFQEGAFFSVSIPWAQARIVFRLVQPVQDVMVDDDIANLWPIDMSEDQPVYTGAPGVDGAINIFFVRDVEVATAYMYFGGGPGFIGDESGTILGAVDWQQVVAHEIGHSLCLRHICDGTGEGPGTFFNRDCENGDEAFLMYPFWDTSDGMAIDAGQVDPARTGATHFEDGKTAALPPANLFNLNNAVAQCQNADTQN